MKIKCLNEDKRRRYTIYTILQVGFVFLLLKKLKKYIHVTPSPSPSPTPPPTPPTPPGPPLPEAPEINLTDIGTDTITVNWTSDPNADSYNIERSTDGVNFTFIANVLAPLLSFIDIAPPLTPNTTYYYRVNGQNTTGQGPFSAIVSGTTLPIPPGPPSTWTSVAIPGTTNWNEIVSNNGSTWMATAGNILAANKLLSTDNGATWLTISPAPITSSFATSNAITFFSFSTTSRFLCLSNLFNTAYYTDDSGTTWTQSSGSTALPGGSTWTSVCNGNGKIIGVRSSGIGLTKFCISTDNGANFSPDSSLSADNLLLQSVCYGEPIISSVTTPRFVAVGGLDGFNQNAAYSDSNGQNWTRVIVSSIAPLIQWNGVCFGNGIFVAVGFEASTTNGYAMYSTDGVSWTTVSTFPGTWQSVNFGNGYFVAVSNSTTVPAPDDDKQIIYSTDGITWTQATSPSIKNWNYVSYSSGTGRWIAIDTDTAMICDV